ncbi:predicted protein [Uncinocarpus reesii 1704]|uniref:Protein kinase domain-containing protein n=1 Tax=Uncinocarpus reesii (strain UAMH 1704) TaxID=336963 RepID=C4JWI1_UNCRE|nr:uncharacterized protein UREG_06923 [Uncinocarpus reesii 1704]EEP82058.1 predicted protein [Uncinocarpus reesii 1704]
MPPSGITAAACFGRGYRERDFYHIRGLLLGGWKEISTDLSTHKRNHVQPQLQPKQTTIMETIAYGVSSVIYKMEHLKSTIIKHPFPDHQDDLRCEQQAYELLGSHPRIAKYHGRANNNLACEIEYYQNGCIDQAMLKIPEILYLKWSEQIAEALVFVHSKGIIHCDIRSPTVLVTDTFDVVLADFASCRINGVKVSTVTNNTRYRPPSYEDSGYKVGFQDDCFAFGSLVYFLLTREAPYKDLPDHEVVNLYVAGTFTDVSNWPIGAVIEKCWRGEYLSATQLLKDISNHSTVPLVDPSEGSEIEPIEMFDLNGPLKPEPKAAQGHYANVPY